MLAVKLRIGPAHEKLSLPSIDVVNSLSTTVWPRYTSGRRGTKLYMRATRKLMVNCAALNVSWMLLGHEMRKKDRETSSSITMAEKNSMPDATPKADIRYRTAYCGSTNNATAWMTRKTYSCDQPSNPKISFMASYPSSELYPEVDTRGSIRLFGGKDRQGQ